MFKKGDKVTIKSPPELLLPRGGTIHCEGPQAMPDVYVVALDMPYYGLNIVLIHKKWLKKFLDHATKK